MDETWVPDDQEQVEDRVHRASNVEHQVDVWYVRTEGTVEQDIAAVNMGKAESNHTVLDAERGLRFARERFGTKVTQDGRKDGIGKRSKSTRDYHEAAANWKPTSEEK
jgi:SNF2 family DNA or RNA helicase